MKGSAGIPELQLVTLNKLIQKLPVNPNLFFTNLFSDVNADSDAIEWEVEYGSAGITPFVAPGAVAPKIGMDGVGKGSAKAAYMKEAAFLDEQILNNLREPGTHQVHQTAARMVAKQTLKLRNRMDRRREWMMAKAILQGGFTYLAQGGSKITVSYGIPETHQVTLGATRQWDDGADRNVLEDVLDGKQILKEDAGVAPEYCFLNSDLLKLLMLDTKIQALMTKSAFGDGDLFARPAEVIGSLLGVGTLAVFDEFSEIETLPTSDIAIGATSISIDNAVDVAVGATARFIDHSQNNVWEDRVITAVNISAGTMTVAATTKAFKAGRDSIRIREKMVKDDEFIMWNSKNADGMPIAENMLAPFGLGRNYGVYMDTKDEFDPEGTILRIQNKSLPTLFHPDCSYKLIVR